MLHLITWEAQFCALRPALDETVSLLAPVDQRQEASIQTLARQRRLKAPRLPNSYASGADA
jgi:hypothetical protein